MNRAFTNILCNDVKGTARFYQQLLGMRASADFGWFVILAHDEMPGFELGVLDNNHATIPSGLSLSPGGSILTFVVNNVEDVHAQALSMQAEIIQEPTDLPYGQRRLLLRDPAGSVVDISSPTP